MKRKRQGQTWSASEDAVLREASAKRWSAERIGLRLGRSKNSVKRRAGMLGVPLTGPVRLPPEERATGVPPENAASAQQGVQ